MATRRFLLLTIAIVLLSIPAMAHTPLHIYPTISISPFPHLSGRVFVALSSLDDTTISYSYDFSVLTFINDGSDTRFSFFNGVILIMGMGIAGDSETMRYVSLIPLLLPNLGVEVPISNTPIRVYTKLNTDFYLFTDVSRICSEVAVGIKSRIAGLEMSTDARFPITKGFRQDKSPYLTLSIGIELN